MGNKIGTHSGTGVAPTAAGPSEKSLTAANGTLAGLSAPVGRSVPTWVHTFSNAHSKSFSNDVSIVGKRVLLHDQDFTMKGISYSAENQGFVLATGGYLDPIATFDKLDEDFAKIAKLGANTVRIYDPFLEVPGAFEQMLKAAEKHGLKLLVTFPKYDVERILSFVKKHRFEKTILAYLVGNEVNGNKFYGTVEDEVDASIELSRLIRQADGAGHPIFSSWGDVPSEQIRARLAKEGAFDGASLNYFRNPANPDDYKAPLQSFAQNTPQPVFFGEYGTDSYVHHLNMEDTSSQKEALEVTNEHISELLDEGALQGVCVFSYKDQIHRSDGVNAVSAYISGSARYDANPAYALGYGPDAMIAAIDGVQNDEFLGLHDKDGKPKVAASEIRRLFASI